MKTSAVIRGVTRPTLNFTVNVPIGGVLSLSTQQSGFDDLTDAVSHLPTRDQHITRRGLTMRMGSGCGAWGRSRW